ncbi:MAG: hypothetical protein KDA79_01165 [Planctomycetaceae bacterium]|nr:hypothetical protein [Planctomycetaceae bacterium]
MFRCQRCEATVPPGTSLSRIAISTRTRRYPSRPGANPEYELKKMYFRRKGRKNGRHLEMLYVRRRARDRPRRDDGPRRQKRAPDYGGCGQEIARELRVCPKCREEASAGPD